jgi:predicted aspartyl protease
VAERLKITEGEAARVYGVGGRARARKAVLSEVKVGPARVSNLGVAIIGGNGAFGEGLLGMDFLRGFSYRVDYARGVIIWEPQGDEFEGMD